MVDAKRLLADLKRLHRRLQEDLREQHAASAQRDAVHAEWRTAFDAKRTADTFETFWSAAIDQAAVHWILAVVFIRFLEDNRLIDRPLLSGPGERLDLAQERWRAYFRAQPLNIDTDYLLDTFADAARLPGLAGLYDRAHNPLFRLKLSGDEAIALREFFQARVPETGELVHDFTDPAWNTRFLGDLYQDLSEEARKRYALLQTPEFVEEWILDRTLDPAMREFGATKVRMIDPACGSGHFLLGGFARVLAAWQREEPDMPPAAQAQHALNVVSGVDLNPFAVEIARFRLLLAALQAAEVTRLTAAPAFRFSLAVGIRCCMGGISDGSSGILWRSRMRGSGAHCGTTMRLRTLANWMQFSGGSITQWLAIRPTSLRRTLRCATRIAKSTSVAIGSTRWRCRSSSGFSIWRRRARTIMQRASLG